MPTRRSPEAAGYDLTTCSRIEVPAGETVLASTGLALEMPRHAVRWHCLA